MKDRLHTDHWSHDVAIFVAEEDPGCRQELFKISMALSSTLNDISIPGDSQVADPNARDFNDHR